MPSSSLRSRLVALVVLGLGGMVVGCGSDSPTVANPRDTGPVTTTTSPPTVPIQPPSIGGTSTSVKLPTEPLPRLVAKLKAVNVGSLKVGVGFNTRLLGLSLMRFGFTEGEGTCIAAKVAAANPGFGDWTSTQVVASVSTALNDATVSPCVTPERRQALAKQGPGDGSNVPPNLVRTVVAELASSGFESVGMTATEANCVAGALVNAISDQQVATLMTSGNFEDQRVADALPKCLDATRIASLAS